MTKEIALLFGSNLVKIELTSNHELRAALQQVADSYPRKTTAVQIIFPENGYSILSFNNLNRVQDKTLEEIKSWQRELRVTIDKFLGGSLSYPDFEYKLLLFNSKIANIYKLEEFTIRMYELCELLLEMSKKKEYVHFEESIGHYIGWTKDILRKRLHCRSLTRQVTNTIACMDRNPGRNKANDALYKLEDLLQVVTNLQVVPLEASLT